MLEMIKLRIDEEGKILLPDSLLQRLCLKRSCSVPLCKTDTQAYVMPSAISAIFMATSNVDIQPESFDEEDEDLTEEEIERLCFEYRHGVQDS